MCGDVALVKVVKPKTVVTGTEFGTTRFTFVNLLSSHARASFIVSS